MSERECWWCEVRLRWWQPDECKACRQSTKRLLPLTIGLCAHVPSWCERGAHKGADPKHRYEA